MVDNILTITLLGNHDASFWLDAGIDIKTILENRRHDIIPVGYDNGIVKINDFNFILEHPIDRAGTNIKHHNCNPIYDKIFLHGHSHRFKLKSKGNTLNVYIPSSSQITNQNDKKFLGVGIPSIIDAEFTIKGNTIKQGNFSQYILLNNQLIKVGEYEILLKVQQCNSKINEPIKPALYTSFTKKEIEEENKVKKLTPTNRRIDDQIHLL